MTPGIFIIAFLFPLIAFGFLGYLVYAYRQKWRPYFSILALFILINYFHFNYGLGTIELAFLWLALINVEAFIVFIFALLGWKKLKEASK
jgi:uncharacterized membrane protein YdjX (TVP38/TMEM64 family)